MSTREMILQTAFLGFLEKGFDSISLNELIKRTNLTKGAFYYHFKSKEELLKEIIDKYFHSYIDKNGEELLHVEGNIYDKVNFIVKSIGKMQREMICFGDIEVDTKAFHRLFLSAIKKDDRLRKHNEENTKKIKGVFELIVKEAQDEGYIKKDISASKIANLINICIKGTMVEWMVCQKSGLENSLKENLLSLLEIAKVR